MPLEATMIVLDNSEYMRNGDYAPTRFAAQGDAATTLFDVKVNSNPENTVGVMTMASKGPEVLVTHTREIGQIHSALHDSSSRIGGSASIPTAIAIAQLALKHRQNKNLRQRVVLFVGSPIEEAGGEGGTQALVKLAKKLKKNNVAVDVVAFGDGVEEGGEENAMRAFVEAANSGDNSHYVSVPPGAHFISDALLSSPILSGDSGIPEESMADGPGPGPGAGGSGPAGGSNQFEFGVDPSLDPELAMALRMSMEEEQARQAQQAATQNPLQPAPSASASTPAPAATTTTSTATATTAPAAASDDDEDALLQRALAMSSGEGDVEMASASAESTTATVGGEEEDDEDEEMSEEEAIARAIEMSMKGEGEGK